VRWLAWRWVTSLSVKKASMVGRTYSSLSHFRALQTLGSEAQQLGAGLEIPIRVDRISITEIGGEHRECGLGIGP